MTYALFLSLAALRLAQRGVLVRSGPAIETLGRVDVLCTDKTGTLTEGRFSLERLIPLGGLAGADRAFVLRAACEPQPTDTLERAIEDYLAVHDAPVSLAGWTLAEDRPFDPVRKVMSHLWTHGDGRRVIAMKGAWEGVRESCEWDAPERARAEGLAQELAGGGYRVLAFASARAPFSPETERDRRGLRCDGLLAFADPVRTSVPSAVQSSQSAGIEVKIMSGDHLLTTHAVADRIGLEHTHDELFSGADLDRMSPGDARAAYLRGRIFARITGEHKLALVRALQSAGKIVAVTGDGMNDLSALKAADVGVSMGATATPAARATARLVLLREDFSKLVFAIGEGRRVFTSLRQSFTYLIAFHVPIVVLSFWAPLARGTAIWLPVHIVLFEFLVHPISAFAFFSATNDDAIPPRTGHRGSFFGWRDVFAGLLAGAIVSVICAAGFDRLAAVDGVARARTIGVLTFIFSNIVLVALALGRDLRRQWRRFAVTAALILAVSALIFATGTGQRIFRLEDL